MPHCMDKAQSLVHLSRNSINMARKRKQENEERVKSKKRKKSGLEEASAANKDDASGVVDGAGPSSGTASMIPPTLTLVRSSSQYNSPYEENRLQNIAQRKAKEQEIFGADLETIAKKKKKKKKRSSQGKD